MNSSTPKRSLYVVLIDDEKGVLLALKLVLGAMGHLVKDFNHPVEAVEYIKSGEHIDLVICDLRMPGLNGLEVLAEVRAFAPKLPFLLISGHAEEDDIKRAKELGSTGFVGKPFSPDELAPFLNEIGS